MSRLIAILPHEGDRGRASCSQRLLCVLPGREQQIGGAWDAHGAILGIGLPHQARPATGPPPQPTHDRIGFHASVAPPRGMITRNSE